MNAGVALRPDVRVGDEADALGGEEVDAALTISILSAFMLGTPYIIKPAARSARSYTVTRWPALLSWSAAARPAGPDPMTATFLPVRLTGGLGTISPRRTRGRRWYTRWT